MATRHKAKAYASVPQTRDAAAADIREIGDLQRQLCRVQIEMNDALAHITATYQPTLATISEQIKPLQQGVQAWCEAHRAELTNNEKVKTANLITGEVSWRKRPASVSVRGVDAVIEALLKCGLKKFVRAKEEINKEAILAAPGEVKGVRGIKIVDNVEDFVITPFENDGLKT